MPTHPRLNETSGIIQNTSNIYSVEISSSNEVDSGILIFPLNTLYFSGETFLRCTDENGRAYIRVVSFDTSSDSSDGDSGSVIKTEPNLSVGSIAKSATNKYSAPITYDGDGSLFAKMNITDAYCNVEGDSLKIYSTYSTFSGTLYAAEGDDYTAKSVTFSNP